MNAQSQILDLPPTTNSEPGGPPTTATADTPRHPAFANGNRGNGKIARLPKDLRDQVNNWILDGVSYPEIISRLGDQGKHLKVENLSEWKKFGYQDWLLQREFLGQITSKSEFSADVLSSGNASGLHEAGLRIAAAQMIDQLMRFSAVLEAAGPQTQSQPEKFARLVNALSRLTREAVHFQKYHDAVAAAKTAAEVAAAAPKKERDPNRKLTDGERLAIVSRVDDILGIRLPVRKSKREPEQNPADPIP